MLTEWEEITEKGKKKNGKAKGCGVECCNRGGAENGGRTVIER